MPELKDTKIVNIQRGRGLRAHWVYAELRDTNDKLLASGTIEYIIVKVQELARAEFEKEQPCST